MLRKLTKPSSNEAVLPLQESLPQANSQRTSIVDQYLSETTNHGDSSSIYKKDVGIAAVEDIPSPLKTESLNKCLQNVFPSLREATDAREKVDFSNYVAEHVRIARENTDYIMFCVEEICKKLESLRSGVHFSHWLKCDAQPRHLWLNSFCTALTSSEQWKSINFPLLDAKGYDGSEDSVSNEETSKIACKFCKHKFSVNTPPSTDDLVSAMVSTAVQSHDTLSVSKALFDGFNDAIASKALEAALNPPNAGVEVLTESPAVDDDPYAYLDAYLVTDKPHQSSSLSSSSSSSSSVPREAPLNEMEHPTSPSSAQTERPNSHPADRLASILRVLPPPPARAFTPLSGSEVKGPVDVMRRISAFNARVVSKYMEMTEMRKKLTEIVNVGPDDSEMEQLCRENAGQMAIADNGTARVGSVEIEKLPKSQLYICSVDIQQYFDRIDRDLIYEIVEDVLSDEVYYKYCYYSIKNVCGIPKTTLKTVSVGSDAILYRMNAKRKQESSQTDKASDASAPPDFTGSTASRSPAGLAGTTGLAGIAHSSKDIPVLNPAQSRLHHSPSESALPHTHLTSNIIAAASQGRLYWESDNEQLSLIISPLSHDNSLSSAPQGDLMRRAQTLARSIADRVVHHVFTDRGELGPRGRGAISVSEPMLAVCDECSCRALPLISAISRVLEYLLCAYLLASQDLIRTAQSSSSQNTITTSDTRADNFGPFEHLSSVMAFLRLTLYDSVLSTQLCAQGIATSLTPLPLMKLLQRRDSQEVISPSGEKLECASSLLHGLANRGDPSAVNPAMNDFSYPPSTDMADALPRSPTSLSAQDSKVRSVLTASSADIAAVDNELVAAALARPSLEAICERALVGQSRGYSYLMPASASLQDHGTTDTSSSSRSTAVPPFPIDDDSPQSEAVVVAKELSYDVGTSKPLTSPFSCTPSVIAHAASNRFVAEEARSGLLNSIKELLFDHYVVVGKGVFKQVSLTGRYHSIISFICRLCSQRCPFFAISL